MPVRSKVDRNWPAWYHSPNGDSQVFERIQDVPYGWTKSPPVVFEHSDPLVVDEDVVRQKLTELGVDIDPTWGRAHLQKVLDDRSPSR